MIMFDKTKPEQITVSKVLENVDEFIKFGGSYPIRQIYNELSIFDWWPNNLNQNHLKQMRSFLKLAIKLGYDGYCCFKVGASGCANGMWAYKARSTTGYSPNGACIYRSFTPDYTYYSFCDEDGKWSEEKLKDLGLKYDSIKTQKQLVDYLTK